MKRMPHPTGEGTKGSTAYSLAGFPFWLRFNRIDEKSQQILCTILNFIMNALALSALVVASASATSIVSVQVSHFENRQVSTVLPCV